MTRMKARRPWPWVTITKKGELALRGGHPWVYAGEVLEVNGAADGGLCDVMGQGKRYLGTGFYNSNSLLRVRVFSDNANDQFDDAFWRRRMQYAVSYRQRVMGEGFSSCRLVYGDADGLPGLTVDKFEDMLVVQVMCLGIDLIKEKLLGLLCEVLAGQGVPVRAVYERSEGALRQKEGLADVSGFLPLGTSRGQVQDNTVIITENGIKYRVDIAEGQKTGFFLDQKYNRLVTAQLAQGLTVLDCFTHTGAFALNCLKHGAQSVTCVDSSQEALDRAQENAVLNGMEDHISFVRADALQWLPQQQKQTYDMVILDPPAFAKKRTAAANAFNGYRDINRAGLMLLKRGGFLATASCSHHMPREQFLRAVQQAAQATGLRLKQIAALGAAPDHPVLMGVPENEYLKFYLFQAV